MTDKEAGARATKDVREQTLRAAQRAKITPGFVLTNLKRLASFKQEKPFKASDDTIIYSKPMDVATTQAQALALLADILGMRSPEKHEVDHTVTVNIVNYGDSDD